MVIHVRRRSHRAAWLGQHHAARSAAFNSIEAATTTTAAEAHFRETLENALTWERKPLLRAAYEDAYERIRGLLARDVSGNTVELGSGLGKIKTRIPHCITTDLVDSPFVDRVESAYALDFASESLSNLILFDVFHHLRYPGTAMDEFHRVLAYGGRLILFEPAMSVLGRMVFGLVHKEPLGDRLAIEWRATSEVDCAAQPYYAAQGNCHRIFVLGEFEDQLRGWHRLKVEFLPSVAYLGSGGFSGPQLYPTAWLEGMRALDRCFAHFPSLFATRMVVVLEKM